MAPVAALLAAMVLLAPDPVSAEESPEPEPAGDLSRFESATVVSGLSMLVERPDERLVAERDITYTIAVNNSGEDPEEMTIRVTVPPWMPEVRPLDGGEVGEGYVDWPVTVAPGEVTMMRLTGAYASPGRDAPTRVAFTACALATKDSQPIVCATDVAQLEPAPAGSRWWLIALVAAGLAAAAGAAAALYLLRRRRAGNPTAPPILEFWWRTKQDMPD